LDPQSVECIFFGYPEGVKGYIFLDSHSENFILDRSAKFEEESLHDFSEDPAEELLVFTNEEESETSLITLEKPSENNFGSDTSMRIISWILQLIFQLGQRKPCKMRVN
jgi:hypothetical protein